VDISIIIPCRNEGENVRLLTDKIYAAMPVQVDFELIFIDDSNDETTAILERLSDDFAAVRFKHRDNKSGLSTAIVDGFAMARGKWFIIMDADLQHPPASLPSLLDAISSDKADIIVPSRFIPGGDDGGLNYWRKFVSWTARTLARVLISKVKKVTDPTSGFFAVKREVAFSQPLNPIGWKILLELLVRSDYRNVIEIPYRFESRDLGASKFNVKAQWNYIMHLLRLLRSSEQDLRFWKFSLVGLSGVLVNSIIYVILVKSGFSVSFAFVTATIVAMLNNFIWNNRFTWKHIKSDKLWFRIAKFTVVSLTGLCISSLSVSAAHHWLGFHYMLAGFSGIVVSTGWNFVFHNMWTFKSNDAVVVTKGKSGRLL